MNRLKFMAQISKELVLEFQEIIRQDYDREVTTEEALQILSGLVGYFDLLAKIQHKTQQKKA